MRSRKIALVLAFAAVLIAIRLAANSEPPVIPGQLAELKDGLVSDEQAQRCGSLDGTFAVSAERLYCLGPEKVSLATALESMTATDGTEGGRAFLVLRDGPEGLEPFNQLADLCFARADTCPTGQLALINDQSVLSAPELTEARFTQLAAMGQDGAGQPLSAADLNRYLPLAEFRPVHWSTEK